MQVLNVKAFDKRILYNAAKAYSTQLKDGEGYSKLNPVIALTIADFEILKGRNDVISHFVFKEKQESFDYPNNELEMVFVELPKFHQAVEELKTLTEKWIYFMKNTNRLEAVPETMGIVPEIQKAFRIASQANLSRAELEDLEKREFFIEDQRGAISKGKQEGLLELLMRLLKQRFGTVAPEVETRIEKLSNDHLEDLGEALLDFTAVSDLIDWLQAHKV